MGLVPSLLVRRVPVLAHRPRPDPDLWQCDPGLDCKYGDNTPFLHQTSCIRFQFFSKSLSLIFQPNFNKFFIPAVVSVPGLLREPDPVPVKEPDVVFMFVDAWPTESVAQIPVDEQPPDPTFCEIHVGPENLDCTECIPGLFVCPTHFVACGGEALICCFFCWRVLCDRHEYCPCAAAISRRRDVALAKRNRQVDPPIRGARGATLGSHVSRPPKSPRL